MRTAVVGALLASLLAACPATAGPSGARGGGVGGPIAFIVRAYDRFALARARPDVSELDYAGYFAPALRRLVDRDRKIAGADNVPNLDYDPFCQCQDDAGLTYRIVSAQRSGPRAEVVVLNRFHESPRPWRQTVTYKLIRIGHAWRVDDIGTRRTPSLKRWLAQAIRGTR